MPILDRVADEASAAHKLAVVSFDVMLSARAMADRLNELQPGNHFGTAWPALEAEWRAAEAAYRRAMLEVFK